MSKIICDVCGTSFSESAMQCPICGCVRSAEIKTVAGDTDIPETENNGGYTYVKGGRFSKTNVRKRNTSAPGRVPESTDGKDSMEPVQSRGDKGLVVAVVLLLLAIIAVVIYICVRFFGPDPDAGTDNKKDNNKQNIGASQQDDNQNDDQSDDQDDQVSVEIPCVSLVVSDVVVTFDEADKTLQLHVTPEPADTTDEITYTSDDEKIAKVDEKGLITAVGAGETIIRVKCGNAQAQCSVKCTFESTTTNPDDGDNDEDDATTVDPNATVTLNRTDFTMSIKGEKWNLYTGSAPVEDVIWTTSDTDVATVENGIVTMVGNSFRGDYATITAEYNGAKVTCIVRWGGGSAGVPGNGNVTEAG